MLFEAIQLTKVYEMSARAPREKVFPLLCPVREYDWLPGWRCRMIHSASGVAESGCVFETDLPGREEMIWVVTRYEPPERIQYTIFKPGSHVWTLDIRLAPLDSDQCRLTWSHAFTGLTEAGNKYLADYTDEKHRLLLGRIERCLVHFLKTGTRIEEHETA
jgi:hypothetical protein